MAITTAVVQGVCRSNGDGTGTTDYTSSGFGTPDAAIVIFSGASTGSNPSGNAIISVGFVTSAAQNCCAATSEGGQTTTDTERGHSTSICAGIAWNGSWDAKGVGSLITDGLQINWTSTSSNNKYITIHLIKGVSNAKAFSAQLSSIGINDITSIGFQPDMALITSINLNTTPEADATWHLFSFGGFSVDAEDTISQGMFGIRSQEAAGAAILDMTIRNDSCVGQVTVGSIVWKAEAKDIDTNGFSLDTGTDDPGNDYVFGLALKFADGDAGSLSIIDTPTTTGTEDYADMGILPSSILLGQTNLQAVNTVVGTGDAGGYAFGQGDGTNEYSVGLADEDGSDPTDCQSDTALASVAQLYYDDGSSTSHVATIDSFLYNGVRLDFSDTDATARKWLAIGFGEVLSAAVTGTATANIIETDVVSGSKTIIITLTNDTWVAAGGTFDAQRQNIINGLDSAQSETYGWDAEVKAKEVVGAVVRTSDTVVTITLSAAAAYDISTQETITVTIPAGALVTSGGPIIATPDFTVDFESAVTGQTVITTIVTG